MNINLVDLDRSLDLALEAAVLPSRWAELLNDICIATGSRGAHVLPLRGSFSPGVPATASVEEGFDAYFKEGWQHRDVRFKCLPVVLQKGVAIEHDISTDDDIRSSPYYNEFLARFGFRYSAMVGFTSGSDVLSLGLQRGISDEPFSRQEEHALLKIRSRLTIAAEIMRRVSAERVESMSDAFDIADVPCVFFDRLGRVSRLNLLAERLLDDDIKILNRELSSARPDETAALRGHIRAIIDHSIFQTPVAERPVKFSRRNKRPVVIRAQRLVGIPAEIFSHSVALAIITDLEDRPIPPVELLQTVFRLTTQEAIIATMLAAGLELKEIALRQAISYETVRTHMKSTFHKTNTVRQSELVSLLSNFRTKFR